MMHDRITVLRKERGYTLAEMARRVGTTKAQIQKLEKGERRLSLEWMTKIAIALDLRVTDLIPLEDTYKDADEQAILDVVNLLPTGDRLALVQFAKELVDLLQRFEGRPGGLSVQDLQSLVSYRLDGIHKA